MKAEHDLYPDTLEMGKEGRKAYQEPHLTELGDLRTLTLGVSGIHGGFDLQPGAILLADGSILMPDGSKILPNGMIIPPIK